MIKKLIIHFKKKGFIVEKGYKSTSILVYDKIESLPINKGGKIGIICGGTSDIGIAEEARIASLSMGCSSYLGYDVGIAEFIVCFYHLKKWYLIKWMSWWLWQGWKVHYLQ